jgi:hypothetical protein
MENIAGLFQQLKSFKMMSVHCAARNQEKGYAVETEVTVMSVRDMIRIVP